jgi:hypothetical protein
MTIQDLIKHCEIRLEYLAQQKFHNIQLANSDMVNKLDVEIFQTEQTLNTLKSS